MQRVSSNVWSDFYLHGCVPSIIETSEGAVLVDTPNLPSDAMRLRARLANRGIEARYIINTEAHTDHVYGNSYFPEATVVAHSGIAPRYLAGIDKMHSAERVQELATSDPDSVWLVDHPDFPPNPPRLTFDERFKLEVGSHTFECLNMPGHTAEQTAVVLYQEGVLFTGDNVFSGCKTWMQEADPWCWLDSLKRIAALDIDTIVPGHGPARDLAYLSRQAEIVANWLAVVGDFVDAGMTEAEALDAPIDVRGQIDPYPVGQGYFAADDRVTRANVRNLYRRIVARR